MKNNSYKDLLTKKTKESLIKQSNEQKRKSC